MFGDSTPGHASRAVTAVLGVLVRLRRHRPRPAPPPPRRRASDASQSFVWIFLVVAVVCVAFDRTSPARLPRVAEPRDASTPSEM